MLPTKVPTHQVTLWMAGDVATAHRVIRDYCYNTGSCFTITPSKFIYTGGEEDGFSVGLVNYPKFPSSQNDLDNVASDLASRLMKECNQKTCLLVGPHYTEWVSINPPGVRVSTGKVHGTT